MKTCEKGLHQYPSDLKRCMVCKNDYKRAYYAANKAKVSAVSAAWYAANIDERRRYSATYNEANKEGKKAWRAKNPDKAKASSAKYHAANLEKRRARSAKWSKDNPAKANAQTAKRKALKLRATPAWANTAKIEEFYHTARALRALTGEVYHVDHIIPLKSKLVCGLHWEGNLQILTASENHKKWSSFATDQ